MKQERQTEQKELLIRYLKENANRHITIQEIQEELENKIGQTTIYRIINLLIKKGTVIKIPFDNKQGYCYKYNLETQKIQNHYHLICEECKQLIHFKSKEIFELQEKINKIEEFIINNDRIVFYGKCKKCKVK